VLDPAAVEQVDELRTQLRELALRQALHRPRPGHRHAARLELELHAAVWRHARRGASQHVGIPDLELGERRVVGALEAQLCVGQAEGREVQLRAVLEHLHPFLEASGVPRFRRSARATAGAGRLQCGRFGGREGRVVGVERP